MIPGSLAGEPMVLVGPESPELATTVMPAATALSLAMATGSFALSGNGLPPKDSLRMLTLSTLTAQSMAWTIVESKNPALLPATFITAMLAPGGTPLMRMLQLGGRGCAAFTNLDRS